MTDAAILDMIAFNEAKATMKAKFPTMVQYFIEDTETYIGAIREGIAVGIAEKIVSPAHTLKSSSRQMGAIHMSEIAKEMEALAREQSGAGESQMPPFSALLARLEAAFAETRDALRRQVA